MVEPTTASSPPTSQMPPTDAGTRASPDDFAGGGAAGSGGSGDTPPPPERKQQQQQQQQQYSSSSSSSDAPPPTTAAVPSSAAAPSSAANSKRSSKADRYGLGGSSMSNSAMKFQFYVPSSDSASSADGGGHGSNLWGSNRSASSERVTSEGGGGGSGGRGGANKGKAGGSIKQQQQPSGGSNKTGGGGSKTVKGIDPPEKELPTYAAGGGGGGAATAEESARRARDRLMRLQHRESREMRSSAATSVAAALAAASAAASTSTSGLHASSPMLLGPPSRGKDGGTRRVSSSAAPSLSDIMGSTTTNDEDDDDDVDDDDTDEFLKVNIDPIESDDEPVSDHFDDDPPPPNNVGGGGGGQQARYKSPVQGRTGDQMSYMNHHPSSAPVRPSHRLPPQQLMAALHAGGRGTFGRQGQGQGGQPGIFPLPLDNNGGGGAAAGGPPPPGMSLHQMHQHLARKSQAGQHPQYQQQQQQYQQHQSQQQQQQRQQQYQQQQQQQPQQYRHQRRKSANSMSLYSDGIDILEKAASEAREREEAEALNDGISYLRGLESSMGGTSAGAGAQYGQGGGPTGHSSRKVPPPPPPPSARIHRPPPRNSKKDSGGGGEGGRKRSSSLDPVKSVLEGGGDEALEMQQQKSQQQPQQQQQGQGGGRPHRPPPPRQQPLSVPTTPSQVRKRPVITAAAAMDFVMNAAAARPLPPSVGTAVGDDEQWGSADPHREGGAATTDADKMNVLLNTLMQVGSGDGDDDSVAVVEGINNRRHLTQGRDKKAVMKAMGSFDSDSGDSSPSSSRRSSGDDHDADDDDDDDDDDFERNTSLSMHAEAKFGSSKAAGAGTTTGMGGNFSRYAEDKRGMADAMALRLNSLQLDDNEPPRRNISDRSAGSERYSAGDRSQSAPYVGHSLDPPESGERIAGDNAAGDRHLQVGEHREGMSPSVLHTKTMDEGLYAVETVIPTPTRYHEEYADEVDSFDQAMPRTGREVDGSGSGAPSHALGPRSKRPGGITGVVLDGSSSSDNKRDYRHEPSMTDSSSEGSHGSRDDDSDSCRRLHALGDSHSLDDLPRRKSARRKWGEELLRGIEGPERRSVGLMMRLCSHLPAGIDAFREENEGLEWDDDDPDEPGYVVHRLTNPQLIGVENAFEKMVASIEHASEEKVRNGSNERNFERDLEEAEMILDRDERRRETEAVGSRDAHAGQGEGGEGRVSPLRESVPDFPGIYPPGKGRQGEMECFYLPVITKSQKTGFEPTKDLVLKPGSVFANNYLVQSELGSAAFSTAYRCLDLGSEEDEDGYQDEVCLKVIKNTKDYFDQSLDEIKILQMLKDTGRAQENNVVEMRSFFYHREHLVIVTELLRQNLYEFGKSILESRGPLYFTRLRLSHITRQCLVALKFVHELGLMHCDIKPENILLSSYSRALVKVIDFGSSSFVTDRQSSYIQSRSYRAPEVILGLPYGGKIDMWSLGCVVAELYTNEVTFQNDSELSMLSRIEAICGPFPRHMIAEGRNSHRIFTDSGLIYEKVSLDEDEERSHGSSKAEEEDADGTLFNVYQPKMTTVAARLGFDEDFMNGPKLSKDDENRALFVDFVSKLLTTDPDARPSAAEALKHPWITSSLDLTEDDIRYG